MFLLIFTGVLLTAVAFLLIILVLLQNPKDDGGNILGANNPMKQLLGSPYVPHFLHKVTYITVVAFLILTLLFTYMLNNHYSPTM